MQVCANDNVLNQESLRKNTSHRYPGSEAEACEIAADYITLALSHFICKVCHSVFRFSFEFPQGYLLALPRCRGHVPYALCVLLTLFLGHFIFVIQRAHPYLALAD